jgi:1-acyl-sn-glycerol-3-phosphate acyltransferase
VTAPGKEGLRDQAVSVGLWAAGLGWLVPMMGTLALVYRVVPPERTEWLTRLYMRVQLALTLCRWRAVVHPAVDPRTPYMFLQNHINHFDYVTMYRATPHFKQGIEREDHFRYPFYGWLMRSRGTIPIKKGVRNQSPEVLERIRRAAAGGASVVGFPEGTRTLTGRVGEFRKGLFFIARDVGLPIVPVAVTGMYRVMHKGSWVIHPGADVTVWCEEPVPTAGLSDDQIPALVERVRAAIARRVDEVQEHGVGYHPHQP